jgi:hypothetical protein
VTSIYGIGWRLDRSERAALLQALPPAYPDAVADHVTLRVGVSPKTAPPRDTTAEIVGVADDGEGVQAMVVRIDGTTDRPGGGTYHITWSLDRRAGRKAVQSNDVIAGKGWTPLEPTRRVSLTGYRFAL